MTKVTSEEVMFHIALWIWQQTLTLLSNSSCICYINPTTCFNNGYLYLFLRPHTSLLTFFTLSKLKDNFGNNIGLYRDDRLVLLHTKFGRLSDKAIKDLTHAFNKLGLNVTAQANQLSPNFLDAAYKLYGKPNNEQLYINRHSNHPPPIIRQLPISVSKRINSLSCNKEIFHNATPLYNHAQSCVHQEDSLRTLRDTAEF